MDGIQRGINSEQDIRVVAAVTTELTREACDRHELRGAEAVILGRALTAACLMATLTKTQAERVRIAVRADGPAGSILVDARGDGGVRGCLERRLQRPEAPLRHRGRNRIGHLVGQHGTMVVTRDLGLDQPYQGVVEIVNGEIDGDLERYLGQSEQLPSALVCDVLLGAGDRVLRCVGILCQTFPQADEARLDRVRENLRGSAFGHVLRQPRTTRELIGFALLGQEFEAMDATPLRFRCSCGRDRALAVMSTLGADDIESLAHEPGDTEVRCSYCGSAYTLEVVELLELAARLRLERS